MGKGIGSSPVLLRLPGSAAGKKRSSTGILARAPRRGAAATPRPEQPRWASRAGRGRPAAHRRRPSPGTRPAPTPRKEGASGSGGRARLPPLRALSPPPGACRRGEAAAGQAGGCRSCRRGAGTGGRGFGPLLRAALGAAGPRRHSRSSQPAKRHGGNTLTLSLPRCLGGAPTAPPSSSPRRLRSWWGFWPFSQT